MTAQLAAKSMQLGQPVFIRIFKETSELEVWVKNQQAYGLFKTYPICNYSSGDLGPKLKEGDRQSPEGFYTVALNQLNPNSSYHLIVQPRLRQLSVRTLMIDRSAEPEAT